MATLDLPVVGGDDNAWGEKINNAIAAVNADAEAAKVPVNFYRRYVNGAWQVRGTTYPTHPRTWVKDDTSFPDPPVDATYFLAGTDILLRAT